MYDGLVINSQYSNFQLISDVSSELKKIPVPQIPKYFSKRKNEWIDNPDAPEYYEALKLYNIKKNLLVYDVFLENAITLTVPINTDILKKIKRYIKTNDSNKIIYIKYHLLTEKQLNDILTQVLLFENSVDKFITFLKVTRNGQDILNYPLRNNVNVNIDYEQFYIGENLLVHPLHEYNACISSNMDWSIWMSNKYSIDTKAYTIALYRLNKLTEIHSNDEVQSKSNSKHK